MQLTFLRVATLMKVCVVAMSSGELNGQLGANTDLLKQVKSQSDDTAEFKLLAEYLKLDTNFASTFTAPTIEKVEADYSLEVVNMAVGLNTDFHSQLKIFLESFD